MDKPTCKTDGCERPLYCKGSCEPCYKRAYSVANSDQIKAYRKAYVAANSERLNASRREREDPDLTRAASDIRVRAWNLVNPDRRREIGKEWRLANPDRFHAQNKDQKGRRRARKMGCVVTKADFAAIIAEHGMVCHICGLDILTRADLHFDHVIPLAKGGAHCPANIRPSHALCNLRKSDKVA